MQQVVQPSPSADGLGRQKVQRESNIRTNSEAQSRKSDSTSLTGAGLMHGIKVGGSESPSHDRLVYLATCLIGHQVEVQVKKGSIYSGIFHSTNTEKDFGVILKMARLTKDGSSRGQNPVSDSVSKAPSKTLIIPAKELVQVIAKGVSLTEDGLVEGLQSERRQDIMIDSFISKSHYVELERELERWTPDENDSQCPEYENIFDGTWNRKWDQFETNKALFGVKSTFDEELYTTKLEKGPQMRELEKEALRIAREIEGEETRDLHLAEERGLHLHEDFNIDEETRYSSVFRGFDDSGYEEVEDIMLDSQNTETFGGSTDSVLSKSFSDVARRESSDGAIASTTSSSVNEEHYSQSNASKDLHCSSLNDQPRQVDWESRINVNQFREQFDRKSWSNEFKSSLGMKKSVPAKLGLSPGATAYAPSSNVSSKGQEYMGSLGELSHSSGSDKKHGENITFNARKHGKSTSSTPDCASTASAVTASGLSPSSSLGSLSSEKSTLNPYAKEFKFNPNAKSFTPSQTPPMPPSPVAEGCYYFPTNVSAGPHMHSLPMGIGIGLSFSGPQPVIYNSQGAPIQAPQAYVHPNRPTYGQQMILGHPRQALYMPPSYPTEMPYK